MISLYYHCPFSFDRSLAGLQLAGWPFCHAERGSSGTTRRHILSFSLAFNFNFPCFDTLRQTHTSYVHVSGRDKGPKHLTMPNQPASCNLPNFLTTLTPPTRSCCAVKVYFEDPCIGYDYIYVMLFYKLLMFSSFVF